MAASNSRRKVVEKSIEQHRDAAGNIPLTYKSKEGFLFAPVSKVKEFTNNRRNGLPSTKFYITNPANGNTIGILVQCNLRAEVKEAYVALEAGQKPVVKFVHGNRLLTPDWSMGGVPVISATALTIEYPKTNESDEHVDPFMLEDAGFGNEGVVAIQ